MPLLAIPTLVPYPFGFTYSSSSPSSPSLSGGREPSPAKLLPVSGVDYWLESCETHGISRGVGICGLRGIDRKTLLSYQRCWTRFSSWYNKWACGDSRITVNAICEFLLFLFRAQNSKGDDYSGEALNLFRSALSFFLKLDFPNLGYDNTITRLFKYFYKSRPSFPRYTVTWDVGKVLHFLAAWHPPESLSIRELTLKTVTLVALTCSDRAQTIQAMKSNRVVATADGLEFVIYDVLKTSRRGQPARVVKCVKWDAPELDVAYYVHKYIDRTLVFRRRSYNKGLGLPTQLFLSHKTGRPVARPTISRWIKEVMSLSGIDTSIFLPGSTRGASASAAERRGASIGQLLSAGSWTNLGTYQRFYQRRVADTPVGRLILEEANVSSIFIINQ